MSVDYFEERQERVAAIRTIVHHLAAEIGKPALDDRVLRAMAKVPNCGPLDRLGGRGARLRGASFPFTGLPRLRE